MYTAPGYPQQQMSPQGYPPAQPPYGGYGGGPSYGQPGGGFGGGGFLQGALQTAAGVAMGEIAVQSIEGLVRGFGREAGYGSDRALGGFDGGSRDFADNSAGQGDLGSGDSYGDRLANADGADAGLSSDIEDRRGDGQGFFGNNGGDSGSGFTDDGGDDSGGDDNGGYDGGSDSGSDDSSSGGDNSF